MILVSASTSPERDRGCADAVPGVAECAAVGRPTAALARRSRWSSCGDPALTEADVRAYCEQNYDRLQAPACRRVPRRAAQDAGRQGCCGASCATASPDCRSAHAGSPQQSEGRDHGRVLRRRCAADRCCVTGAPAAAFGAQSAADPRRVEAGPAVAADGARRRLGRGGRVRAGRPDRAGAGGRTCRDPSGAAAQRFLVQSFAPTNWPAGAADPAAGAAVRLPRVWNGAACVRSAPAPGHRKPQQADPQSAFIPLSTRPGCHPRWAMPISMTA